MEKKEHIIFLHGLFMNAMSMKKMERHFKLLGYSTSVFEYNSTGETLEENVKMLKKHVDSIYYSTIHFVGHSMGGLLIRFLFKSYPNQKPGKCITIGTPHKGAHLAKWINSTVLSPLVGKGYYKGLLKEVDEKWIHANPIGSIAGCSKIGFLWLIDSIQGDHDGTVFVHETFLSGQSDHVVIHKGHTEMILSSLCFKNIENFLKKGHFIH